jgi:hypothetical protein
MTSPFGVLRESKPLASHSEPSVFVRYSNGAFGVQLALRCLGSEPGDVFVGHPFGIVVAVSINIHSGLSLSAQLEWFRSRPYPADNGAPRPEKAAVYGNRWLTHRGACKPGEESHSSIRVAVQLDELGGCTFPAQSHAAMLGRRAASSSGSAAPKQIGSGRSPGRLRRAAISPRCGAEISAQSQGRYLFQKGATVAQAPPVRELFAPVRLAQSACRERPPECPQRSRSDPFVL